MAQSNHPAFTRTDHRPWPIPTRAWAWRQSWHDLLFIHWPAPAKVLRKFVPSALQVQEFDGTSWIGLVPFWMSGVMLRPVPNLPWISSFPELNLRLYVEAEGKPGGWFLSLDAARAPAVWAARRFFHLPYHWAKMRVTNNHGRITYESRRRRGSAEFRGSYRPIGGVYHAEPGSLEHWLTERYCLYAQAPDGKLLRNEVHHLPWPLQAAEAEIDTNTMLTPFGIATEGEPILHFASRIDVVVWQAKQVAPE